MSNCNLPPLQVSVHNKFLTGNDGHTNGTLVSVRALMNQALQFSVLLETGALYTGLPINALTSADIIPLSKAQAYDCIGSSIEVVTLELLRYMKCTVKAYDGSVMPGMYMFTVDFTDENGLARHPVQWKQFHVIKLESGQWVTYPQYRIQFTDGAFCPDYKDGLPAYKYNEQVWLSE